MAKKRFHYLIADRDSIHPGDDIVGHVRKWKISGNETIIDIASTLLTDYLPWNPPKRTETWILVCNNLDLALLQQSWETPKYFIRTDEEVSRYFNGSGDFVLFLKLLWKDRENYFHSHGIVESQLR